MYKQLTFRPYPQNDYHITKKDSCLKRCTMYHITVWILFETGTTRILLLILNGRKQN